MKVLIVGNGAMGSAIAFHLSRAGARVEVFDPHPPGHDQGSSHGETRLTRKAYFESPDYVPLLKRAEVLWRELEAESGESLLFSTGLLIVGHPHSPLLHSVEQSASRYGIELSRLSPARCRERLSWARVPEGYEGVWEPGAGYLRVEACVRAHHGGATRAGARFHQRRVLEWGQSSGSAWVRTDGGTEHGDALVVTAGAGWRPWMETIGVPLTVHENALFWVRGGGAGPEACFAFDMPEGFFYGFPVRGGVWKVALHEPGPEVTGKRTFQPSVRCRRAITAFLDQIVPGAWKIEREATCLYTMSPDGHFIVDRHPSNDRIYLAAGFSGHGFKFAAVLGEEIARGVLGGGLPPGLKFLGLSRFAEPTQA